MAVRIASTSSYPSSTSTSTSPMASTSTDSTMEITELADTIGMMNCADTASTTDTERSVWSPYSSLSSSATPRPRNRTQNSSTLGSAFKWLGDKSMDTFHGAVITKRANAHVARVKEWQKRSQPRLGQEEREKVHEMLGDALEMARQCYPPRINRLSYAVGREVQQWLHSYPNLPQNTETSLLLIQVQICLIPIVLTRISDSDPLAADLAHDLINALTRTPLTLFTTLQDPEKAATTIRIVSRELAYGKCSAQHGWLGVDLLRIVEMVVGLRKLTDGELVAIKELAVRRRQQSDTAQAQSRPWEVALFALCALQNPWFKDAVLGPTGLKSLLTALDTMLASRILIHQVRWEDVAITLRALAFLSEHEWVAKVVEEKRIVRSLLGVFRRSIPERWFCIRFWAMDTIRNILSHRPPLVGTLIRENAAVAFATLTTAATTTTTTSSLSSSSLSSSSRPLSSRASISARGSISLSSLSSSPTNTHVSDLSSSPSSSGGMGGSSSNMGSMGSTSTSSATLSSKTRGRLMEDYKREASKRAEELTAYIKDWTEWKPYPMHLEPVSITGSF